MNRLSTVVSLSALRTFIKFSWPSRPCDHLTPGRSQHCTYREDLCDFLQFFQKTAGKSRHMRRSSFSASKALCRIQEEQHQIKYNDPNLLVVYGSWQATVPKNNYPKGMLIACIPHRR